MAPEWALDRREREQHPAHDNGYDVRSPRSVRLECLLRQQRIFLIQATVAVLCSAKYTFRRSASTMNIASEARKVADTAKSSQGWTRRGTAGWATGAFMLLIALVAKQFVGEGGWVDTLAQTGTLLIGVGIAVELASRKTGKAAYRTAVGIALGSALLLGWVNGAVGIIGSENNEANLLYGGVLAVGGLGAIIARFKPEAMARVLFATALAQTLVAVIALVGRLGSPTSGPLEIVTINGFFVSLFVGSAVLFGKSARS
jgi:hypothetical protein